MPPRDPDPERDPSGSDGRIRDLVRRNPGQATEAEYVRVRDAIRERAPGNVLIFGVGRDSPLWMETNRGGRTVFLESVPEWIHRARREVAGIEIVPVRYDTRRFQWLWLLLRSGRLMLELPDAVLETAWDVIFVDAPNGTRWKSPGRMQSIYTASVLASGPGTTDVLVHDCDRRVERMYCDVHLADAELLASMDRLRHYCVG